VWKLENIPLYTRSLSQERNLAKRYVFKWRLKVATVAELVLQHLTLLSFFLKTLMYHLDLFSLLTGLGKVEGRVSKQWYWIQILRPLLAYPSFECVIPHNVSHNQDGRLLLLSAQLQSSTALWLVPSYSFWCQGVRMWTTCTDLLHKNGIVWTQTHSVTSITLNLFSTLTMICKESQKIKQWK